MIINHNLNAINAHRSMNSKSVAQGKAMEKLSSGLRINRASDDAAGLAISEKMRSQIRGLTQASRNAQDGISLIQTAEGALSESNSIAQRMRELAVQSSNGTYTDEDRKLINEEFRQLKFEIDRIGKETEFNGKKLLDGTLDGTTVTPAGSVTQNGGTGINNGIGSSIAGNFQEKNQHLFGELGKGKFSVNVSIVEGRNNEEKFADISLVDKTGSKEEHYILDSTRIKVPTGSAEDANGVFELYDMQFSLGFTFLKSPGISITLEFENTSKKTEEGMILQIGASKNQTIGFSIDSMRARDLGIGGLDVLTQERAQRAIEGMDKAISKISAQRADLGAIQNRLEHTISLTDNTAENLQASESRIRDIDMAKEMMNLTKLNVLQQASQSMLAQANQAPQQVLSILR